MKRLIAAIAACVALTVPAVAAATHGGPHRTAGLLGCCRPR